MKNFDSLLRLVADQPRRTLSVAVAEDHTVVEAVKEAQERGLVEPILVGDEKRVASTLVTGLMAPSEVSSAEGSAGPGSVVRRWTSVGIGASAIPFFHRSVRVSVSSASSGSSRRKTRS